MARGGFRPTSPRRQGGNGGYGNGRRGGYGSGRHVWADGASGQHGFSAADRAAMATGRTGLGESQPKTYLFGQKDGRGSALPLHGRKVQEEENLDVNMDRQRDRSPPPEKMEVGRQSWADEMEVGLHSRDESGRFLPLVSPASCIEGQITDAAAAAATPPTGEVIIGIPPPSTYDANDVLMISGGGVQDGDGDLNPGMDFVNVIKNCITSVCQNAQPNSLDGFNIKPVAGGSSSPWPSLPTPSGGHAVPGDRTDGARNNERPTPGIFLDEEAPPSDKIKCNISLDDVDGLDDIAPDGSPIAMVEEVTARTMAHFSFSLVGKIMGRRVPPHIIDAELRKRWAVFGDFRFLLLKSDCFVCIFSSADARDRVLQGGPWFINGFIVGLDVWTPTFDPTTFKGSKEHGIVISIIMEPMNKK